MDVFYNFISKLKSIVDATFKQFLIIMLYIFLILILQYSFIDQLKSTNIFLVNIIYVLIEVFTLTIFVLIFHKKLVPDFYDFKKNGKEYIKKYFIYWLIALIIMIISNVIINYYISPSMNNVANQKILLKYPLYGLVSIIICAPIIEECMIRVIFKDIFKCKYIYYIITALLFGLLHINDMSELVYLIPYGTLGYAFAAMYKNSNNIWTNIFYHSFHNVLAVIITFIGVLL